MNCTLAPGAPSHTGTGNFPQLRPSKRGPANDNRQTHRALTKRRKSLAAGWRHLRTIAPLSTKCSLFDQLSPLGVPYDPAYRALEELMENFDELIQRLLEVQSGGRQRSPKLIAEDERLMDGLRLAARPAQTVEPSQIVQSGHD